MIHRFGSIVTQSLKLPYITALSFYLFYLKFFQNHSAPLFHTRYTITVFLDSPGLLVKDNMSLTLTSIRTIAHISVMVGAPALFVGASKFSQTIFRPLGQSTFSTVVQQKAPKSVTMPQRFLARRMREQHRIEQMSARPRYQQKPRESAVTTYRDRQSGRSWDWTRFHQTFWPGLLASLFTEFCLRFVKTIRGSR